RAQGVGAGRAARARRPRDALWCRGWRSRRRGARDRHPSPRDRSRHGPDWVSDARRDRPALSQRSSFVSGAAAPRPPRLRRELLVVGALSSGLTLWSFWPLPLHLSDHSAYLGASVQGVSSDFHLLVWVLAWDSHALLIAPWRIFHANSFYPAPWSLAYS